MPTAPLTLSAALKSVGVAQVNVGDPFTLNGLVALGATEGDITAATPFNTNDLKAPEFTGDIVHVRKITAGSPTITAPVIVGDTALWPKITPTGTRGAGWSVQQNAVSTSVVVVPFDEMGASWSYNGTVWAPAAPVNTIWFWKATPIPGDITYKFGDGGKVILPVTFTGMFYGANPEGHKVYTIGDPVAQGITTVRV